MYIRVVNHIIFISAFYSFFDTEFFKQRLLCSYPIERHELIPQSFVNIVLESLREVKNKINTFFVKFD